MGNIQTSNFVQKLAANDRPTRLAALESLKKFLTTPRSFPLIEYEKLWKGLFYAMWFSDKPRPQQRLAKDLSSLFTIIPKSNYAKFTLSFWLIISREWSGIDHHRIDKFLLLVRRAVHSQIKRLQMENWDEALVEEFLRSLKKVPLSDNQKVPAGISYHLVDVYVDELEKVMFEDLEEDEDEDEENEDENINKRIDIIESTPLKTLIAPFEELSQSAKNRTLKDKIKNEFLDDSRLKSWGIIETEEDSENENESDEQSEDDWKGFN